MKTSAMYGAAPEDLGLIELSSPELMLWLYCPVKLPGQWCINLPDNLAKFAQILQAVHEDIAGRRWWHSHVYLTAKTLFVKPGDPGNRPGWHSDGFLTNDLNYIWSDSNPTVFWVPDEKVAFTADHGASLGEMDRIAEADPSNHRRYPDKHLLRLDQTVIHKVEQDITAGTRTFVKVSVSEHRYALLGNSINHRLAPDWTYKPRNEQRNCPTGNDKVA